MATKVAPCVDCIERYEACWGSCEKYLAWKSERDKALQAKLDAKLRRDAINAVQYKSRRKNRNER